MIKTLDKSYKCIPLTRGFRPRRALLGVLYVAFGEARFRCVRDRVIPVVI